MVARIVLLLVASLAVVSLVLATSTPTCQLSNLILRDKAGVALTYHDAKGKGFSASSTVYYCNCGTSASAVTVTVSAPSNPDLTYHMKFTGADKTTASQYLSINTPSKALAFTTGTNRVDILPSCAACTATYTVYCTKSPPGGTVVGDPQFTGLRGQEYQVHGVSGEVYNIISDEHLQMNSKFVFLNSGACPVVDGKKAEGCWSHAGSYLGEIGIKTSSGDRLKIVSGRADQGFAAIELNGVQMQVGDTVALPCPDGDSQSFVTYNSTYIVTVRAGAYLLEFENSDMFINQKVHVQDWSSLQSHGLLGQTWSRKTYKNTIKYVEGRVDDYAVRGKNLFGDEFLYNQYVDRSEGNNAAAATTIATQTSSKHLGRKNPKNQYTLLKE